MSLPAIFLLALGLAMDAMAAAAAQGLGASKVGPRQILLVALLFGGFQALMPLLGWGVGTKLGPMVQAFDHWIAFVVLGAIGGKMLWEARTTTPEGDSAQDTKRVLEPKVLLLLAIATSVDAFAAGIALPVLRAPLGLSVGVIGIVTAVLSAVGLMIGRRYGALLGKRLDVVGGLLLIGLGSKILIEHLGLVS